MTSGGGTGPPPPNSGGEFLLQLLQKPKQQQQPPLQTQNPPPPPRHHYLDPAVAAVGPTLPFQSNGHNHNHHPQQPPPQWLNHPAPSNTPWGLAGLPPPPNLHSAPDFPRVFDNKFQQLDANGGRLQLMPHRQEEKNMNMNMMMFGSLPPHFNDHRAVGPSPSSQRGVVEPRKTPPPGFHQKPKNFRKSQGNVDHASNSRLGLSGQLDHPGPPGGSKLWSVPASDIEESLTTLHEEHGRRREEVGQMSGNRWKDEQDGRLDRRRGGGSGSGSGPASKHRWKDEENKRRDEASGPSSQMGGRRWKDDLSEQLMNSVRLSIGLEKNARKNGDTHDTESKSDLSRELQIPGHRMRNHKRIVDCRSDIDKMNAPFLAIFDSLVPAEEEKEKQKQLLASLEKLVSKEWPTSQLYLYGSCANSFGVSKSDIDVCLAIKGEEINKSELLLRLADILKEDNLENVQALTHARVPIVKLMDPVTGISCDICVNNVLAVVNTKLLRDYAEIDCRLRQLAFIVKHWAKSRGVNVTYQGTLSSYAYVLMCIHFLQQRRPAILPCLQGMEATYVVSVEDIKCSYFDKVENLRGFGAQNKESIAQLVWAFFDYWAYRHDYSNAVISVRTGSIISKRAKDWTRRIGNDRHLICIEDPFEISHDLGRVVDKYSIKILRDEFHRAAHIMQYDPDPCVTLFEPCVPEP